MNRWKIIGAIAVAVIVCVSFWLHFKKPSDAHVRRILPSTWHVEFTTANQGESRFEIDSNLNFTHRIVPPNTNGTIESSGRFQVNGGTLIETMTKSTYTKWHLPVVRSARIVRANRQTMVVFFEDANQQFTLRRDGDLPK